MSELQISNRRRFQYNSASNFLKNWNWEWLVTLTFPPEYIRLSSYKAKYELLKWTRELCVSEHIQVCYFFMLCYLCGHPHFHVLMIGHGNNDGEEKTLKDISRNKWAKRWPHFAKIEIPRSIARVAKYIAAHYFSHKCDRAILDSYNTKLLRRQRLPPTLHGQNE